VRATTDHHEGARIEGLNVERREVDLSAQFGIRSEQDLEPAVEPESVDHVGAYTTTDVVLRLEDRDTERLGVQMTGGSETGEPRPDDDDVDA